MSQIGEGFCHCIKIHCLVMKMCIKIEFFGFKTELLQAGPWSQKLGVALHQFVTIKWSDEMQLVQMGKIGRWLVEPFGLNVHGQVYQG